jgi:saccharopine dehydrogenase (NAD+, L-lysine forming)
MTLWIRHEVRPTERRAPLVPADAALLVERGVAVTVEESPQRAFPMDDYVAAGCRTAPAGSWVDAPRSWVIVGIKELPPSPDALVHRHVYFGHAYKGQEGAAALLGRFAAGGGALLDIEYLVDDAGRRLAAFGYWAGYVGAALAVRHLRGDLPTPLAPSSREDLDAHLRPPTHSGTDGGAAAVRALVIGALGRSGRGARAALAVAGIATTGWDLAETRELDRPALLAHDILVNTVLTTRPQPPLLTRDDVADPVRRLSVVADVTADVTSENNLLPIYEANTTWEHPATRVCDEPALDVIAIDNLPSLLPVEASVAFSTELAPLLATVDTDDPAWARCAQVFRDALARA